jgi:hypothetical protein
MNNYYKYIKYKTKYNNINGGSFNPILPSLPSRQKKIYKSSTELPRPTYDRNLGIRNKKLNKLQEILTNELISIAGQNALFTNEELKNFFTNEELHKFLTDRSLQIFFTDEALRNNLTYLFRKFFTTDDFFDEELHTFFIDKLFNKSSKIIKIENLNSDVFEGSYLHEYLKQIESFKEDIKNILNSNKILSEHNIIYSEIIVLQRILKIYVEKICKFIAYIIIIILNTNNLHSEAKSRIRYLIKKLKEFNIFIDQCIKLTEKLLKILELP